MKSINCFLDDFRDVLSANEAKGFEVVLDFAAVSRMEDAVHEVFSSAREMAQFAGAKVVTFVARNDDEVADLTSDRLQQVLEGNERYVAYRLSA